MRIPLKHQVLLSLPKIAGQTTSFNAEYMKNTQINDLNR